MFLTVGILADFFEECGCIAVKIPSNMGHKYDGIRVFYPGIPLKSGSLYLINQAEYAQFDGTVSPAEFCLLTEGEEQPEDCAFVIRTGRSLYEVFGLLQERMELLVQWDHELSEILLRDGSLQEILECSAPILRAPCFLQDSNFYLLASCGHVAKEDNLFFYETLRTGRAPSGLFTQLLSMSPSEQPYASPRAISSAVKELPDQQVLIADCCVDGVTVLHFCLFYGKEKRKGFSDLIIHLMQRMELGPAIRRLTSKSTDLHDELFTKIIDAPDDGEFTNICSALGLFRFQQFTAVCIDFGTQHEDVVSKMTKLRALYPRFWLFRYQNQLFALMGSSPESLEGDLSMQKSLLQQLQDLSASFGTSFDLFPARSLKIACQQASDALSMANGDLHAYADVMVQHMIQCFYDERAFRFYCPAAFYRLLEDDHSTGNDNLTLLHTFLFNNCNATAVSRILHMHRNNVLYRMDKIKAKYHFDLNDGQTRLLLQILTSKAMMDLHRKD